MTPFEKFFAGDWYTWLNRLARSTDTPLTGDRPIADASWDRRAAYLLWLALRGREMPAAVVVEEDIC